MDTLTLIAGDASVSVTLPLAADDSTDQDDAELRKRQERFQTRMLEAASALEERGMSEERKAETGKGAPKDVAGSSGAGESRLLQLLREARRNARDLRLEEGQRRVLDEYYESLLTR